MHRSVRFTGLWVKFLRAVIPTVDFRVFFANIKCITNASYKKQRWSTQAALFLIVHVNVKSINLTWSRWAVCGVQGRQQTHELPLRLPAGDTVVLAAVPPVRLPKWAGRQVTAQKNRWFSAYSKFLERKLLGLYSQPLALWEMLLRNTMVQFVDEIKCLALLSKHSWGLWVLWIFFPSTSQLLSLAKKWWWQLFRIDDNYFFLLRLWRLSLKM